MSWPAVTVTAYFDLPTSDDLFVLDDPVRGVLGSSYVLAGDIATDITQYVRAVPSINRGRQRTFDVVDVGTCTIELDNRGRVFDSLYSGSPFFGNVVPGKRMSVAVSGMTVFDGEVESYRYTYDRNQVPICVVTLVDALGTLAGKTFDGWTATSGQTVGQRLTSALNRDEVLFASNRSFDAGVFPLQADSIPANTNALKYAQEVVKSDFGRLFADRRNVLTFRDRRSNINVGATATFSLNGEFPFIDVQRDTGSELLINRVVAGRRGGATTTFDNLASQAIYGIRGLSGPQTIDDLLLLNDADAFSYGEYIASIYSTPEERFSSFTFIMNRFDMVQQAALAALDINSLVRGIYTPGGLGDPIDRYCIIEGVHHQIQRNRYLLTFYVGDAINRTPFILDDPVLGVLDGPGVLVF